MLDSCQLDIDGGLAIAHQAVKDFSTAWWTDNESIIRKLVSQHLELVKHNVYPAANEDKVYDSEWTLLHVAVSLAKGESAQTWFPSCSIMALRWTPFAPLLLSEVANTRLRSLWPWRMAICQ